MSDTQQHLLGTVYGVRKNDIAAIKTQSNWVELNGYIKSKLESLDMSNVMGLVKQAIDFKSIGKYNSDKLNVDSPYRKFCNEFTNVVAVDNNTNYYIERLLKAYNIVTTNKVDPTATIEQYKKKVQELHNRYPLLSKLNYYVDKKEVVDYINMVDQVKGI